MTGHADSIRRAREIRKEGVVEETFDDFDEWEEEEEWEEEDEWEDEEDEWDEWEVSEKPRTLFERVLGPLIDFIDFIADVAALAMVPTALLLVATAYRTTMTFDVVETVLLLFGATATTLMITNTKTRLLQRLRLRFR